MAWTPCADSQFPTNDIPKPMQHDLETNHVARFYTSVITRSRAPRIPLKIDCCWRDTLVVKWNRWHPVQAHDTYVNLTDAQGRSFSNWWHNAGAWICVTIELCVLSGCTITTFCLPSHRESSPPMLAILARMKVISTQWEKIVVVRQKRARVGCDCVQGLHEHN